MTRRWGPPPAALKLAPGDDTAVWQPGPGLEILLTSDLLVEGVHFSLKTISPWQLGARSLAASLSDLAAMGGMPRLFLSSIAAPRRRGLDGDFFEALADGAGAWGDAFGATLAGGDLSSTPGPLVLDITAVGEIEKGRALKRSGAKPGDWLLCTGNPGDSAAGLALLSRPKSRRRGVDQGVVAQLARKHLTPVPRVLAGRWLTTHRAA